MERSKVIEHLQQLKCDYTNYWEETHDEMTDALDNAIANMEKLYKVESIYDLLAEHFGGCRDILESREEVEAWLERIRWNNRKCDELGRKLEKIEQVAREGKNESRCEKILEIIEDGTNEKTSN